ncbi:ABC transporter ATP-binding protein [Buttiauxella selenatireducens]|uniref:ABC-type dipeptide transporter n=1 Tax=Buttiauxella selenatireducens TaxID=3073902 RepID=A0ABY9SGV5_9ENTR|nr:ABC transporter ATP-binding protein [Buttiauxella sp. R73]WMY76692.1 ABC transporter ATP-binding protein [Buttiauxella sp. R73]
MGESGSGKSVTSLSIMGLLGKTGSISGGEIHYRDRQQQVHTLSEFAPAQFRKIRGAEISMVFQEPMTSLNPLYTVGEQIMEMIRLHQPMSKQQARRQALEILQKVEIPAAATRLDDYPHSMSGGMRQRVMIAMALACNPSLLIADEPTTALDVTIQAQILDLLERLQREMNMSIIFITHNLGVVAQIAQNVLVMYAGRVVEQAPVEQLFSQPNHPYTRGLLACMPGSQQSAAGPLYAIPGNVPSLANLPKGCAFAPRCDRAKEVCTRIPPELRPTGPYAFSRCLRSDEL